jgi:Zn-dependent protease
VNDLAPAAPFSQQSLAPATAPLQNDPTVDEPKVDLKKKFGPYVGLLILALTKAKVIFAALKFGKLATTFGSMLVSIGFYALLFGWKFAVGFVLLIFVHEMGHVLALKRRGIPIEGMFFIPFMGAAVSFKKRPRDPAIDAEISWAGPFAGLLGGMVCAGLFLATNNILWLALAHTTFLLNLINLAPSIPLDGGWIVKAINPKFSLVGSLFGVALGLYLHSVILVIIAGLGIFSAYSALRNADDDFDKPEVPAHTRLRITAAYLGLVLILGGAMGYSTHVLNEDRARRELLQESKSRSALLLGESREVAR